MPRSSYENFDLLILPISDGYQARVISSPAGQAHTTFRLPFSAAELQSFTWLATSTLRHLKPAAAEETHAAALVPQAFGERLFRTVFADPIDKLLLRSYDLAQAKGHGLRIRLRIDAAAPELAGLPWEYLYVPDWATFPALSTQTPLVRYVELNQPEQLLPAQWPLRILTVVSDPTDVPRLAVEAEWTRLQTAVAALEGEGRMVMERLSSPTLAALQDRLRAVDVHILHFIGHGYFDLATNQGSLLFEHENRTSQAVSADQLATLLHDEGLRLVFLNACEGARSGPSDAFAGVAAKLVQQGIPAVLAMQFAVSDEAAVALGHEFYKAIADQYAVEAAVSEARKKIYAAGNEREWGTPVLFMRSPDGYLFGPEPVVNPPAIRWHPRGSLWLAAGLLGVITLVGLGYLLLADWPVLQNVVAAMAAVFTFLLGFLGLREDKTFFARLSVDVSKRRWAQLSLAGLLMLSLGLWGAVGWPKLRAITCGPLGCTPAGVQRFAIAPWENLTAGASRYEGIWTTDTRNVLYDKLSRVEQLQSAGVASGGPPLSEAVIASLDLWIQGNYRKVNDVSVLSALLIQNNNYQTSVAVEDTVDEAAADVGKKILALQNRLAEKILESLDIKVSAEVAEAIRNTPTNNPQALLLNNAGIDLYQHQDYQAAARLFQQTIDLDPAYASPHNNLGLMRYFLGDFSGAQTALTQAIELSPRNPIYHYNLALALEGAGEYAAAVQAYGEALRLDPAYVSAWNNLGYTYLVMDELAQAVIMLQHGLDLAPNYRNLHKNLGRVYLEQGKAADAAHELQRSIDLSPENVYLEAFYYLALAYRQLGQTADACAALQKYQQHAQPTTDRNQQTEAAAVRNLVTELACP